MQIKIIVTFAKAAIYNTKVLLFALSIAIAKSCILIIFTYLVISKALVVI